MILLQNATFIIKCVGTQYINPFLTNVPILYPLKTAENFGFLVFSVGIKWEHWPEMG